MEIALAFFLLLLFLLFSAKVYLPQEGYQGRLAKDLLLSLFLAYLAGVFCFLALSLSLIPLLFLALLSLSTAAGMLYHLVFDYLRLEKQKRDDFFALRTNSGLSLDNDK